MECGPHRLRRRVQVAAGRGCALAVGAGQGGKSPGTVSRGAAAVPTVRLESIPPCFFGYGPLSESRIAGQPRPIPPWIPHKLGGQIPHKLGGRSPHKLGGRTCAGFEPALGTASRSRGIGVAPTFTFGAMTAPQLNAFWPTSPFPAPPFFFGDNTLFMACTAIYCLWGRRQINALARGGAAMWPLLFLIFSPLLRLRQMRTWT